MKDLDTLGVLGKQKTVFFQEPPIEYVQKIHILEKKLEIATKALKEYMTFCRHPAEEALKEMEGV